MYILGNKIKQGLVVAVMAIVFSSCIFDKDLEQDRHIASFRHEMLTTLDSLGQSNDRIREFEDILRRINSDVALITPRKKNELVKSCYSFISNEYYSIENYEKAIEYSSLFITLDSLDARGYFNRGVSYQGSGDIDNSLADYLKAIELNSKYTPAYYNAAIIYGSINEYDKALEYYTKSIKEDPINLKDIYINRGNIYESLDNYTLALEDYSAAIELDTLDLVGYSNRASIYTNLKEYDKALADYSKAIEIDSLVADSYNKRAYVFELQENYVEALADYVKTVELDSRGMLGQRELAREGVARIQKSIKTRKR